jgi:voltage-gated potassium channel
MPKLSEHHKSKIAASRNDILHQLQGMLQLPMMVLGTVWLILIILELTNGLSHTLRLVEEVIWIIFILDFLLRFSIAPKKFEFLKHNWLTTLALLAPALRVFQVIRIVRAAIATGGLRLVQIVGTFSRGMRALRTTLGRRGFGYVSLLSVIVALVGAAGIYAFERDVQSPNGLHTYSSALYWTLMMITTIGSDYWPQTPAGKILTVLLSFYSIGILGYIAASISTFFIDRDANNKRAAVAGEKSVQKVLEEIRMLREEIRNRRD